MKPLSAMRLLVSRSWLSVPREKHLCTTDRIDDRKQSADYQENSLGSLSAPLQQSTVKNDCLSFPRLGFLILGLRGYRLNRVVAFRLELLNRCS